MTEKNGFRLDDGPELASATPTRREPWGVFATRGPPLSPEQIALTTARRLIRLFSRRTAVPTRRPESQIPQEGRPQDFTETSVAVSRPTFCLPTSRGFLLPNPETERGAPACV